MIKSKFTYEKAQCPNCGYSKDGLSFNEYNLLYIVSDIYLPNVIFIAIEDKDFNDLGKTKNKVNILFKSELRILNDLFELIAVVYMPVRNHFTSAIFNYNNENEKLLKKSFNYYYDSLKDDGKIMEIDEDLSNQLNNYIKHLFIYSKK